MKPLYLSIQGINSFNERQEIFFDRFSDSGLFCICGPTGSGKTTVFDSIVLSLYGKGNRGRISEYVNLSCNSAEVCFEFESAATVYRVERIFYRENTKPSKCLLLDKTSGKVLADTVSAADQKLKGIIGLLREEFTQVALIEQGRFGTFLNAEKAQRNAMVGNLFRLDKFKNLFERFNSRKNILTSQLEILNEQAKEYEIFTDEYIAILKKNAEEISINQANVEKSIKLCTVELDKQKDIKQEWNRIKEAAKKLETTKERKAQLLDELNKLTEKQKKIDEHYNEAQNKKQNVQKNRQLLGTLEGIKHTYSQKKSTEDKHRLTEQRLNAAKNSVELCQTKLKDLKASLKSTRICIENDVTACKEIYSFDTEAINLYLDSFETLDCLDNDTFASKGREWEEIRSYLITLKNKIDEIDETKSRFLDEIKAAKDEIAQVQSHIAAEKEIWSKSISRVNFLKALIETDEKKLIEQKAKLKDAQLRDQASIIKSKLSSGDSCPVCGGVVSINSEENQTDYSSVIEKELASIEKELFSGRDELSKCEKAVAMSGVRIENAKEKEVRLLDVIKNAEQSLARLLDGVLKEQELNKLPSLLNGILEGLSKADKLASDIKDLMLKISTFQASVVSFSEELGAIKEDISRMQASIVSIIGSEDLPAMEKRIEQDIQKDTDFYERFEKAREEVQVSIREKNNLLAGVDGEIKSIAEIAEKKLEFDEKAFDKLENERNELELSKASLTKELIKTEIAFKDAEQRLDKKSKLEVRIKELVSKTDKLALILKIVKGDRFLEFVAEEYIIRFTYIASQILAKISSGKYTLEYLDGVFYVRDFLLNNELRRASTLSGGETFLASLSLAIAITKEISGYKSFEFFFLDEGFGTLDAASLDIVYEAIETLSKETLVGIITHRSELVDKIQSRITISPTTQNSGSRITHFE